MEERDEPTAAAARSYKTSGAQVVVHTYSYPDHSEESNPLVVSTWTFRSYIQHGRYIGTETKLRRKSSEQQGNYSRGSITTATHFDFSECQHTEGRQNLVLVCQDLTSNPTRPCRRRHQLTRTSQTNAHVSRCVTRNADEAKLRGGQFAPLLASTASMCSMGCVYLTSSRCEWIFQGVY